MPIIDDPVNAVITTENTMATIARAAVGLRVYNPTISGADKATAISV
jgi:phosphohistidine swiveling domain-containing protein